MNLISARFLRCSFGCVDQAFLPQVNGCSRGMLCRCCSAPFLLPVSCGDERYVQFLISSSAWYYYRRSWADWRAFI